jgi:hypothetical protein
MIDEPVSAVPRAPRLHALGESIRWICQSVRFAAICYALWTLYLNAAYWSSVEKIDNGYGRLLSKDLSGVRDWQQAAAFGVTFFIWLVAAYACFCAWRLFSTYLDGEIFTLKAAQWLRRLALFGLAAQALGILTRPLISVILTLHFPAGQKLRVINVFLQPDDLSTLLLLFGLLALAHIQKTAAEIAEDHAQIV